MSTPKIQFNIRITPQVYKQVKRHAKLRGMTITALVTAALKMYLDAEKAKT